MGKTKTAVVSGLPEDTKSGKAAYEEKRKRKEEEAKKDKKQVTGVGLKGGERIKVIGDDAPEIKVYKSDKEVEDKPKKKTRGKSYVSAVKKIDKSKLYDMASAVKLIKETSYSKFDGSVELHMVVKKDGFSSEVELPHSTGQDKKVEVADEKTIKKLEQGKIDFDILLATADMMPKLVPFAKLLGPKGLMPNPKNGTLIKDKKDASKFKGNKLFLKTERKAPIVHTVVGKVSQKEKELTENISAVIESVGKKQIVKAHLSATISPSVKLDIN